MEWFHQVHSRGASRGPLGWTQRLPNPGVEDRRGGGEEEENDFRMNERRPGVAPRAGDSL